MTDLDVARELLYNLGNYSPTDSQISGVAAWIAGEKPTSGDAYSNNPLNITVSGTPSQYGAFAPGGNAQPGNPIAQFTSLLDGIQANAQRLTQPFASGIRSLLASPQAINQGQLELAVAGSGWGTGSFGSPTNRYPSTDTVAGPPAQGQPGSIDPASGQPILGPAAPGEPGGAPVSGGGPSSGGSALGNLADFFTSGGWGKLPLSIVGGGLVIGGMIIYFKGDLPKAVPIPV